MLPENRRVERPRHDGVSTIALLLALAAALVPLFSVIAPGAWVGLCLLLTGALLGVGYLLRRLRVVAALVTLVQALLWIAVMTAVFFSDVAWLLVVPSPEAFERIPRLVDIAVEDIAVGVAPLDASASLTFLIVGAVGLLVVALDHVVLTARMPLLAGVALIAVWLIPTLAVPRGVDLFGFALLAVALLWLLRTETRHRARARSATAPMGGVGVVSAVIAASAIVVAVIAAPALPAPTAAGGGFGGGTAIDATLDLGNDLRRPAEVPVLRQWGGVGGPSYLRVATLTALDGESWRPDRARTVPLEEWTPGDDSGGDIDVQESTTRIRILDLASAQLPVPYPATGVEGVTGQWRVAPEGRTVSSSETAARGQEYEVTTRMPRPTLEQARAADAGGGPEAARSLPVSMPDDIGAIAAEVTAEATNDYDRLLALQSWFRGPDFDYSLDAPVEDGFDGSGVDAVSRFLQVRSGYCVHFASAFALMARTLDMPSRVVVGFLPGLPTGELVGDARVYQATTAQLHAWPEVFFPEIGWIAFEPTKSLGTPQRFLSEDGGSNEPEAGPTPSASAEPSASASAAPRPEEDVTAGGTSAGGVSGVNLLPGVAALGALLVVFGAPALVHALRVRSLRRRAREGSAAAGWRLTQDAAIDLGIPVPATESPRMFGERLIDRHGAPREAVDRLVGAMERASYAAPAAQLAGGGDGLVADAAATRAAMFAVSTRRRRVWGRVFPRSLVVRPGSTFAEMTAADLQAARTKKPRTT